MNFLKRGIGLCLALLFLLMPAAILAEDHSPTIQKKEETVGRVTLESKEYPLDHYKMEANIGDGFKDAADNALHAINQGMWGFNKTLASFTLYSTNQLMSFDLISSIASEAGIMSERIYEIMSGTFLSLFIIFVGGAAAWRYFVNHQVGHAVKAILGALAIMVLTFWFYSDATGNIKWLNDRGAELEGIASSANVLVSSDEFDSNAAYNPKEGIAVLENQLFNLMVKRPYLLLNYGSTKEADIVSEDPNRVDKLLEIKPYTEEGKEMRSEIVTDEAKIGNKQMSPEFSGERFGYLIITIISTIALAIPVLLLGVFKFLLQVWFLALVIFTAIPLVLSLIPTYSESALNHGKKIVGVLLMKAGLVLLIAVITGIVTLLYESVKVTNGVEGYAFVVFLICITMWGLFKYRTEIFAVASVGMIQGQQVVERATANSFDRMGDAGETGFKGAKRMVGKAYRSHQNKKRQEEFQSGEGGAGRKTSTNGAVASGGRSEHRKAVGENVPQKKGTGTNQEQQVNGKGAKSSAAALAAGTALTRSASRDAGAAIVNLNDYKSGKGEGTRKGNPTSQAARNTHVNGSVSEARSPGSTKHSEDRKNEEVKPSNQRTSGTSNHKPSQHRKPSGRMESQDEVAASRESEKHLTKWEAEQQIKKRNAIPTTETIKRSENREPKSKDPKQRK
ncbi:CD3337/EF1877 family mobilome membrane protein [Metabacillus litoralis]|uniref:CD3337/EF1877 family mobilome membrane protein n=1 Tax=Metabacillus litoralis TaxID=152268 RepID=UPI003EBA204C